LKSLFEIEQSLRNTIEGAQHKLMEQQREIAEGMNENENMKQDIINFSKAIEMGSRENESLKQENHMLKEELLRKHHDNNQNTTSIADKENEIFTLKAELARTKALMTAQNPMNKPLDFPPAVDVDLLLNNKSDTFAQEYIRTMGMKHQEDNLQKNLNNYNDSSANMPQISNNQSTYEKFGYTGPMIKQSQPRNLINELGNSGEKFQNPNNMPFSRGGIQSALPEGSLEKLKKGPQTSQGLPPTSLHKTQEWTPYNP